MYPKKAKDLITEYAEKVSLPIADVEYIITATYRYMRNVMAEYNDNKISMPGLGVFFFRVWKIQDEVTKCNNILRQAALPVFILEQIQEKRRNLIRMDAIILHEMNRRANRREGIGAEECIQSGYRRGCRCPLCTAFHSRKCKEWGMDIARRKRSEENRIKRLQEYERSKGKTEKGMGEQDSNS